MKTIKRILNGLDIARKTVRGIIIYTSFLCAVEGISIFNSPPLKDKVSLGRALKNECEKLNFDPSKIELLISAESSRCDIIPNTGKYKISLSGMGLNQSTLRHESYHVADGHLDRQEKIPDIFPLRFIHYFFLCEPQAAIYESTGLKF